MELDLEGQYAERAYPILASLVTPRPIALLKRLMAASAASGMRHPSSATLPLKPGPPAPPDPNQLAPSEASEHADQVTWTCP